MKPSYHGNRKPYALMLYHAADAAAAQPILEDLDGRGLNLCYEGGKPAGKDTVRRACTVVALITPRLAAEEWFEAAVLVAKAESVPLVCVYLEPTEMPESLKGVLFSQHAIENRYSTTAELCDRIMTAETLKHPAVTEAQKAALRRMALLLLAGAVLIVAAMAVFLFQKSCNASPAGGEEPPLPVATISPEEAAQAAQWGMTEEDLLEITTLVLVGDRVVTQQEIEELGGSDWSDVIQKEGDIGDGDDSLVWTFNGEVVPRGTMTDFSLIGRMKNLEDLVLLNQSTGDLAPLAELAKLHALNLYDCPVESIEPLASCKALDDLDLCYVNVADLSPLAACTNLKYFNFSILKADGAKSPESLAGLENAASLERLSMCDMHDLTDLTALSGCTGLKELILLDLNSLRSLSGLEGCENLMSLELKNAESLEDASALGALPMLKFLCLSNIRTGDLSALADAAALSELRISNMPVDDLSFTEGKQLSVVDLLDTRVRDLNFLSGLAEPSSLSLRAYGDFDDYAGLAAVDKYTMLDLAAENRNLNDALPYLKEAAIDELKLLDAYNLDLTALPENVTTLTLSGGDLADLSSLSTVSSLYRLALDNLEYLTSLAGIESCEKLSVLRLCGCIRLTDFDALYEKRLSGLTLQSLLAVPDFAKLQLGGAELELDNIEAFRDLTFLDAIPPEVSDKPVKWLTLRNMDWIADLTPISRVKGGVTKIGVAPQLEEQAQQLMDAGAVTMYEIVYPDSNIWSIDNASISLLSLDELNTLPDALLARVNELNVMGGTLFNWELMDRNDHWDKGKRTFWIVDRATGEEAPAGDGVIADLSKIEKLTRLQNLLLIDQPLTSIDGIQSLGDLRNLEITGCPVTDASPAFTLTELETVSFDGTPITSIQGVQNLSHLQNLNLNETLVEDLSPLAECDFSTAYENGGLELRLNNIPCGDYAPLAAIERFRYLGFNSRNDAALWLPVIQKTPVESLTAYNCVNENAQVAAIAAIPELRELVLSWNPELTDLTPLLSCGTLEKLRISHDMEQAIASIEGQAKFEIEIEG